jgi:hypothetical protein
LGGQFEINSSADGTIVRAVLPIGEQIDRHAVKVQPDLV